MGCAAEQPTDGSQNGCRVCVWLFLKNAANLWDFFQRWRENLFCEPDLLVMFIRMIHVKASQADEDIEDKFGDNQRDDFLKK